jgi:cell division initiation protein
MIEVNKDLKRKLEQAENESQKLKAVESSLFRTLKTAEDASTSIIAQAEQNAAQRIEQSENIAQTIIDEAKQKSEEIIADAEMRSKSALNNLDVKVSSLRTEVKELETLKNKFISELSKVAQNTLDRVAKITPKNFTPAEENSTEIEFTNVVTNSTPEIAVKTEDIIENSKKETSSQSNPIPPVLEPIVKNTQETTPIVKPEPSKQERKATPIVLIDNIDSDNEVRKTTSVVEEDISFFDMIK